MLIGRDGMKISSCTSLGRTLMRPTDSGLPLDQVIVAERNNAALGVWVPWEIWFQIQHFVSRVIERDS